MKTVIWFIVERLFYAFHDLRLQVLVRADNRDAMQDYKAGFLGAHRKDCASWLVRFECDARTVVQFELSTVRYFAILIVQFYLRDPERDARTVVQSRLSAVRFHAILVAHFAL